MLCCSSIMQSHFVLVNTCPLHMTGIMELRFITILHGHRPELNSGLVQGTKCMVILITRPENLWLYQNMSSCHRRKAVLKTLFYQAMNFGNTLLRAFPRSQFNVNFLHSNLWFKDVSIFVGRRTITCFVEIKNRPQKSHFKNVVIMTKLSVRGNKSCPKR